MKQETNPNCIICKKPVNIMIDSYHFREDNMNGWKHNKCKFPDIIPSILNDNKQKTYSNREKLIPIEQSHRETPSVSGDSATQNSLEKSNIRFVCLNEAICPIIPQRLADQKNKIREWKNKIERLMNLYNENIIFRDKLREEWLVLKKEFEELK